MTRFFNFQQPAMRRLAVAAVIGCAALIAWLSLTPSHSLPRVTWSDKAQHFIAYAALSTPLAIVLGRARWGLAIVLAVGYGALMELGQGTLPVGRSADLLDGVANTLGACAGVGFGAFLLRTR